MFLSRSLILEVCGHLLRFASEGDRSLNDDRPDRFIQLADTNRRTKGQLFHEAREVPSGLRSPVY